jgi:hypothetical protein
MGHTAQDCSYCHSPLVMVDVPRLTAALLLRFGDAVPLGTPAQAWSFNCIGCGQTLDPTADIRCPQCDQSVALPQLHLLTPLLNHVEPVLLGRMPRQARPWGERLRRLSGDVRETQLYRVLLHLRGPPHLPGEFDPLNLIAWGLIASFFVWLLWLR